MGKWSVGAWTDTIQKAAKEIVRDTVASKDLTYQSGSCTVNYECGHDISAHIQLVFQASDGAQECLEADRSFPEKRFCQGALDELAQAGELVFPIDKFNCD